jgi:hypothetical protein
LAYSEDYKGQKKSRKRLNQAFSAPEIWNVRLWGATQCLRRLLNSKLIAKDAWLLETRAHPSLSASKNKFMACESPREASDGFRRVAAEIFGIALACFWL